MSVVDSHRYFGILLVRQFDAFEDRPKKMALQESSHLHPTSFPLVAHMKWMVCKGFKHQYLKCIYIYIYSTWYTCILCIPAFHPDIYNYSLFGSPEWRSLGRSRWYLVQGGLDTIGYDDSWWHRSCRTSPITATCLGPCGSSSLDPEVHRCWIWKKYDIATDLKACRPCSFGPAWTCLDFWYIWKRRGDCCHLWWGLIGTFLMLSWHLAWYFGLVGARKHSHSPKKFCCCHGDVQSASGTSRPKMREWLGRTVGRLLLWTLWPNRQYRQFIWEKEGYLCALQWFQTYLCT